MVPEQRLMRDNQVCSAAHCSTNYLGSRPDAGHDSRTLLLRRAIGNLVSSGRLVNQLTRPRGNPQAVPLHGNNDLINAHDNLH